MIMLFCGNDASTAVSLVPWAHSTIQGSQSRHSPTCWRIDDRLCPQVHHPSVAICKRHCQCRCRQSAPPQLCRHGPHRRCHSPHDCRQALSPIATFTASVIGECVSWRRVTPNVRVQILTLRIDEPNGVPHSPVLVAARQPPLDYTAPVLRTPSTPAPHTQDHRHQCELERAAQQIFIDLSIEV